MLEEFLEFKVFILDGWKQASTPARLRGAKMQPAKLSVAYQALDIAMIW